MIEYNPLDDAEEMTPEEIAEMEAEFKVVFDLSVMLMRIDGYSGDPHEMLYTGGGALPDPDCEAWQRYEGNARKVADIIGYHAVAALVDSRDLKAAYRADESRLDLATMTKEWRGAPDVSGKEPK